MSLPVPDSDALAASHALQHLIAAEIARHDGAISFARFMELALYAPRPGLLQRRRGQAGRGRRFYNRARDLAPVRRRAGAGGSRYYRPKCAQHPRIRRRHRQTGARRADRAGAPGVAVEQLRHHRTVGRTARAPAGSAARFPAGALARRLSRQLSAAWCWPTKCSTPCRCSWSARRADGWRRADGDGRGRRFALTPRAARRGAGRRSWRARCPTPTRCRTAT